MQKYDAIIVGGGLFGQVIAKGLERQGRVVLILDDDREHSGSKPAACLMKPSWFSSMGKGVYEPSLKILDELYKVEDITFHLLPQAGRLGDLATSTVHWIDPETIRNGLFKTRTTVVGISDDNTVHCVDEYGDNFELTADLVVVAAGIWSQELLGRYVQVGQIGAAFLYEDASIRDPFIQPWAPYKQLVGFNRGDGVWVGDGTAIKHANWTQQREDKSALRCDEALQRRHVRRGEPTRLLGIRPYAKGHKPCLLEETRPGLWVAAGGAKNGTVAAGHCAHVIRERTS